MKLPENSDIVTKRLGRSNRRDFIKVAALGSAGFAIGCSRAVEDEAVIAGTTPVSLEPMNAFVRIGSDNSVTVLCKHLDKGQGVTTGLPAIVAEELDADWSQLKVEFAPADPEVYKNLFFGQQGTGGSTSIANSWEQLRKAGAAARAMLVEAAAQTWGVDAATIQVAGGRLTDGTNEANFGELAALAATIEPPAEPVLKAPEDFKLIGTHLPRLDSASKTDGTAKFTVDVVRDNMRIAVVVRPPKFGATIADFDASKAEAMPGVETVTPISRGLAIVADSYFTATQARDVVDITWDESNAETRSSANLQAALNSALDDKGVTARQEGDFGAAWQDAATTIQAQFDFPFLAHASMEPLDCVIELGTDGCDIWTGSQSTTSDQLAAAQILGLDPTAVRIHTQYAGGSFGRRAVPDNDYVSEASEIVKAVDGAWPIKVQWSREDDMRGGRYRPMTSHRCKAALDADGNLVAWDNKVATQSIFKGTTYESFVIRDGIDGSTVEGARNLPYAIPNLHVSQHLIDTGVPILWWRSVGHTHTAYATEVFFDMVARKAGKDPYEWRRELLADHPRHLGVLELAAAKADWSTPLGDGRARGIAVHESFSSFVAQVVEITLQDDDRFSVDRVVCAVDCGIAITPDVVRAQMEGGIGYGLSAALRETITLTDGVVDQSNFHQYQPLRITDMPEIEVHIVASAERPTGVGEPGTPVIAPALANALAAATGKFVTTLPMGTKLS